MSNQLGAGHHHDRAEEEWRRIEAEAREVGRAELARLEATPLEFGQLIAWTVGLYGRTDGIFGYENRQGALHRVGESQRGEPFTTCGEKIPAPVCWLTLGTGLRWTLPKCRYCEAEYARLTKGTAA